MKRYIKTSVVLLAVMAGFTTFAQQKITAEVPGTYRNATVTDTTNIADIKWKSFFEETDLVKLIDAALAKNNDLQIADKNIAIANKQFSQSKWGNVPQLNAFANATSTRLSDNSLNGKNISQSLGQHHADDFSAGLNLSWEADIWGKIRNTKKAAQAAYLQTAEAKKALQTLIVENVSKGFYDLLMLDAQLAIAKKTLELNDSTLFAVNLQYEAGQVTLLAKEQTEAQRLIAAQLIPELEKNIQLQENGLSVLSGTFPDAKERASKLESLIVKENLAVGIPSQLLSKRPDVKSAELALKAANARVGITKATLYPSLTITAVGGVNAFESSNWFTMPASLFGSVAGGLTAPLLNGKKLRTQYEIAKLERDQAAIQFRQTVLTAVAEVSNALVKIEKQKEQYTLASERVETLKKAVSNATLLFRSSMATYFEVNNAQGNLLQAELELATVQKERLSSNVELYRALGGGWE
ncbi:efflux transporter outer membrane subunit [Flavobacterium wongokense]|uniref:efflux transporter outer membrane subunit n=1 Tax=Flavobacterium wongokense TaxID=2910674 RepID=UPI001F400198|nr:efflux transporter outer membrane subunit [Flavobacterium sp. WG47]MCF6132493.1 efflux transporter outer membrane subunit [Flavobacterium sp. WG47]